MLKQKKWYKHQCPYLLKPIFSADPNDYCFIVEDEEVHSFMRTIFDRNQLEDFMSIIFGNNISNVLYNKNKKRRKTVRRLYIQYAKKYYYDLLFWLNECEEHRKMVAWMETDGKEDILDLFINAYRENKLYSMAQNALVKWIGFLIGGTNLCHIKKKNVSI